MIVWMCVIETVTRDCTRNVRAASATACEQTHLCSNSNGAAKECESAFNYITTTATDSCRLSLCLLIVHLLTRRFSVFCSYNCCCIVLYCTHTVALFSSPRVLKSSSVSRSVCKRRPLAIAKEKRISRLHVHSSNAKTRCSGRTSAVGTFFDQQIQRHGNSKSSRRALAVSWADECTCRAFKYCSPVSTPFKNIILVISSHITYIQYTVRPYKVQLNSLRSSRNNYLYQQQLQCYRR